MARLGGGVAVKIAEETGVQSADTYADMPAREGAGSFEVASQAEAVPPLCCPGQYSWGDGRWLLTAGESGWVVVTHRVQSETRFCLSLLADGGAGLTDAGGGGHVLMASAGLLASKWAAEAGTKSVIGAILGERHAKEEAVRAVKAAAALQARKEEALQASPPAEKSFSPNPVYFLYRITKEIHRAARKWRYRRGRLQGSKVEGELAALRGELASQAEATQLQQTQVLARVASAGDGSVSKHAFATWSEAQAAQAAQV
jgi:hypothetical protein